MTADSICARLPARAAAGRPRAAPGPARSARSSSSRAAGRGRARRRARGARAPRAVKPRRLTSGMRAIRSAPSSAASTRTRARAASSAGWPAPDGRQRRVQVGHARDRFELGFDHQPSARRSVGSTDPIGPGGRAARSDSPPARSPPSPARSRRGSPRTGRASPVSTRRETSRASSAVWACRISSAATRAWSWARFQNRAAELAAGRPAGSPSPPPGSRPPARSRPPHAGGGAARSSPAAG